MTLEKHKNHVQINITFKHILEENFFSYDSSIFVNSRHNILVLILAIQHLRIFCHFVNLFDDCWLLPRSRSGQERFVRH